LLKQKSMKEQISLYYQEGSSDKVYHAYLEPKEDGWIVNFAFGRRGSTLQTGTKTNEPVAYEKAKKIYDKIVAEKMAKGYTPMAGGTPYVGTENAGKVSGLLPQLLNMIDDVELELLLNDSTHCGQEKFDGRRIMVRKNGAVEGANKKGLLIALPLPIQKALEAFEGAFVIDGEAIGDTLYVFDLLEINGQDLRSKPYKDRYLELMNLVARSPASGGAVMLVETAWTPREKRRLFEKLKKQQHEGIVFKLVGAPFKAGRPTSGGSQLKYKFYATASVVVTKVNAQRSVAISVYDNSRETAIPVAVGNVTIPANQPVPKAGQVLEVRYLYAYKGGSLFQPTSLGIRDDVDPSECVIGQLKYKAGDNEEDEG
jgi:bifunctional non-homologous end joining protein LigD